MKSPNCETVGIKLPPKARVQTPSAQLPDGARFEKLRAALAEVRDLLAELSGLEAAEQFKINAPPERTSTQVLNFVASYFNKSSSVLRSRLRTDDIVWPRHVAFFFAREFTEDSLLEVGRVMGGRDHGTVLHGCRHVQDQMSVDKFRANQIKWLRAKLREYFQIKDEQVQLLKVKVKEARA